MQKSIMFAVYGHAYAPKKWGSFLSDVPNVNRLYYIHSGTGGYMINDKKFLFEKDKFYLIPSMSGAITFSDDDDPILHTYCDFESIPPIITPQIVSFFPDAATMDNHALDIFCNGGKKATEYYKNKRDFRLNEVESELFTSAIVYLVNRAKSMIEDTKIIDHQILNAIKYMYNNISEKITIEELCAQAFMSKGGFIKKFKKVVGHTPYAYLKRIRLSMAKYLKNSGYSLEYVAEKVGYSDAAALLHAKNNKNILIY